MSACRLRIAIALVLSTAFSAYAPAQVGSPGVPGGPSTGGAPTGTGPASSSLSPSSNLLPSSPPATGPSVPTAPSTLPSSLPEVLPSPGALQRSPDPLRLDPRNLPTTDDRLNDALLDRSSRSALDERPLLPRATEGGVGDPLETRPRDRAPGSPALDASRDSSELLHDRMNREVDRAGSGAAAAAGRIDADAAPRRTSGTFREWHERYQAWDRQHGRAFWAQFGLHADRRRQAFERQIARALPDEGPPYDNVAQHFRSAAIPPVEGRGGDWRERVAARVAAEVLAETRDHSR